jgi:hypothetical protein
MQRPHRRTADKKGREIAPSHAASGDLHLGHRIAATCALEGANVRFGSKADMCNAQADVR